MNENEIVARLERVLEVIPDIDYRSVSASWDAGDGTIRTLTLSASKADES